MVNSGSLAHMRSGVEKRESSIREGHYVFRCASTGVLDVVKATEWQGRVVLWFFGEDTPTALETALVAGSLSGPIDVESLWANSRLD